MPPFAILDTSVYVDHWEGSLAVDAVLSLRRAYVIRRSAVVMAELRRGARTREAENLVAALRRQIPVEWSPNGADWWDMGRLVRVIGDLQGWEAGKRREFQNDALIGLTAHRHGATLVTTNRADFELLAARLPFRLHILTP